MSRWQWVLTSLAIAAIWVAVVAVNVVYYRWLRS